MYRYVYLSTYPSIYLSTYLSISLSLSLYIYIYIYVDHSCKLSWSRSEARHIYVELKAERQHLNSIKGFFREPGLFIFVGAFVFWIHYIYIYIYMCTCIYVCIYIYIYTYIHTYIHMYIIVLQRVAEIRGDWRTTAKMGARLKQPLR